MKYLKVLCVLLLCPLLVGCATGDMEKALTALKWEDYDTAIAESTAYLRRVPDSDRAQAVRETAAWAKVFDKLGYSELSYGSLEVGYDSEFGGYGLTVSGIENADDDSFSLLTFSIQTSYDSDYFSEDSGLGSRTTARIELEWKDNEAYWGHRYRTTTIYATETLSPRTLQDALPEDIEEEHAEYLQEVLPDYLDEVFKTIKNETGVKPEDLGFTEWN